MHDDRIELLDRARQAVERGDYAEAHALAAIALADAGDELAAWASATSTSNSNPSTTGCPR
jgi:hypothetical protein